MWCHVVTVMTSWIDFDFGPLWNTPLVNTLQDHHITRRGLCPGYPIFHFNGERGQELAATTRSVTWVWYWIKTAQTTWRLGMAFAFCECAGFMQNVRWLVLKEGLMYPWGRLRQGKNLGRFANYQGINQLLGYEHSSSRDSPNMEIHNLGDWLTYEGDSQFLRIHSLFSRKCTHHFWDDEKLFPTPNEVQV